MFWDKILTLFLIFIYLPNYYFCISMSTKRNTTCPRVTIRTANCLLFPDISLNAPSEKSTNATKAVWKTIYMIIIATSPDLQNPLSNLLSRFPRSLVTGTATRASPIARTATASTLTRETPYRFPVSELSTKVTMTPILRRLSSNPQLYLASLEINELIQERSAPLSKKMSAEDLSGSSCVLRSKMSEASVKRVCFSEVR